MEDRTTPSATTVGNLVSPDSFVNYIPPSNFVINQEPTVVSFSPVAPLDSALGYLSQHAADFRLSVNDLANPVVTSQYTDAESGTTHTYFRQRVNGLDVAYATMNVAIAANGRVISAGGGFVPGLADRLRSSPVPVLTAEDAVRAAAVALSLPVGTDLVWLSGPGGIAQESVLSNRRVSLDDIPTKLHYVPTANGGAVLAWQLIVRTPANDHWYDLSIDATTGSLAAINDWVSHASYNVLPLPNESPQDGGYAILANPQDVTASPFGWHDTNGVAGAEFTDTRGNNVDSHLDRDANNVADPSPARPDGGASLNFSGYTFDPAQGPLVVQNQNAAMVNLFYTINVLHDIHYKYGFTEVAGNFQTNNYGNGGSGNDAVQADAQDGSGTNNANFGTPPDGSAPRMQQFVFTITTPNRDSDLDNGIIIHEYGHGVSNRLTGGPADSNALNALQSGGMGEGWSDFHALMLMQRATDVQTAGTGMGMYVLGQAQSGVGIRRFRYAYDTPGLSGSLNPLTFDAYGASGTTSYGVARSTEVHDSGELWATTLWDMNWLLRNKYGFDADLSTGWSSVPGPANAGNKLAMRLVMDAMKLQPANPSFIQARDAIIAADNALTGGSNLLQIWTAFARRGLGQNASTANSSSSSITVDFAIPPAVLGLVATASSPAIGATVTSPPASFVITTSAAIAPVSLQASDLTVNGLPANNVFYTAGSTTATFTFLSNPVVTEGLQTMAIAAGAFNQNSDNAPVFAMASNFRYDILPMQVVSTGPTVGSIVALPLTTLDINLNDPSRRGRSARVIWS